MTLFLLAGIVAVGVVILLKGTIIGLCPENGVLGRTLKKAAWFQNHWLSGLFLFAMNAILFGTTILMVFIPIPYVHLLIMLLAVIVSIYLWSIINKLWSGTKGNRLKVAMVGSSFYLFLCLLSVYWLATLEPAYPGEDLFMKAIGLLLAIIVTAVAFFTCFVFTGFSKK